jgi:hypothetical protein
LPRSTITLGECLPAHYLSDMPARRLPDPNANPHIERGSLVRDAGTDDPAKIDRFKELAGELGCDEDEAAFEAALKKLAESGPVPKHETKKRGPRVK